MYGKFEENTLKFRDDYQMVDKVKEDSLLVPQKATNYRSGSVS